MSVAAMLTSVGCLKSQATFEEAIFIENTGKY